MSQCGGTGFWCRTDLTDVPGTGFCFTELSEVLGTGIDVVPIPVPTPVPTSIPVPKVPVLMSYRIYRSVRYRYWCRTEVTEVSGTGIDVVPNLPKCPVPVLMSYRTYRSVRYRYWCCTEITEVSGTGMKVCTGTGGTGIHVVPNLPTCPVPVLMSYRTYRSVWYRYWCRTELTEVSGTSNTGGIYRRYATLRTVTNTPLISLLPRNGWSLLHDYVPVRVYGRYRLDWG